MKVKEIMSSRAHAIELDESIAEAAYTMKETGLDRLVVMDGDRVAGIITERDLVLGCLLESHTSWQCCVYRHMQMQNETVHPDIDVQTAAASMRDRKLAYVPVMERDNLVGLLSFERMDAAVKKLRHALSRKSSQRRGAASQRPSG